MSEIEQRVEDALEQNRRRPPKFDAPRIDLSHGAGGKATHKLIEGLLLPAFDNPTLAQLSDAALLPFGDAKLALTIDSFVMRPLVFPGGSIGELAVNGTNDLAVSEATPLGLSCALIIEEGLETDMLWREVEAMSEAASRAGVSIAPGDIRVVERGKGGGLYVITAGVGVADPDLSLSTASVRPGTKYYAPELSGTTARPSSSRVVPSTSKPRFSRTPGHSPRWGTIEASGAGLRFMRDPTRGGVGTVLNELARDSGLGVARCGRRRCRYGT